MRSAKASSITYFHLSTQFGYPKPHSAPSPSPMGDCPTKIDNVVAGVIGGDSGLDGMSEQQPLLAPDIKQTPHTFPDGNEINSCISKSLC
jgi:hypothetical protein